jgi:hypothetical protein
MRAWLSYPLWRMDAKFLFRLAAVPVRVSVVPPLAFLADETWMLRSVPL